VSDVGRVHYEIPDDLHRDAKAAAALEGRSLREFLIEALRERAARVLSERHKRGDASR